MANFYAPNDNDEAGEEFRQSLDADKPMTDISTPVKRAHHVLRSVALCNSTRMVEREVLKEAIMDNHKRFIGCLMLPVTMSFFVFFALSSINHEDVPFKHIMEFPVRDTLNPLLDEDTGPADTTMLDGLNTISEVWDYLQQNFVPFFVRETDIYGQPLPKGTGKVLEYNQLLGDIKMTLVRGPQKPCDDPLMEHVTCFPQTTLNTEQFGGNISEILTDDRNASFYYGDNHSILQCADEGFINCGTMERYCFSGGCPMNETVPLPDRTLKIDIWNLDRRLEPLRSELSAKMPIGQSAVSLLTQGPKNFEFRLRVNDSAQMTMERLAYLKNRGWIDESTLRLTVDVTLYNYQLKMPRLCNVAFTFYFSRGGGVFTSQRIEVSALKSFDDKSVIAVDLLFIISAAISLLYMMREFLKDMKTGRLLGHFTVSNCVNWFSCAFAAAHIGGLAVRFVLQKTVMASLENYIRIGDAFAADAVTSSSSNVNMVSSYFVIFQTVSYILFMFRCFLSLRYQPRMAMITSTLSATTTDLFHFMLVMLPTWFGFAGAGSLIFGRRMVQFSNLSSAFCFCLQIMFEGEYDWATISSEDFSFALVWMWLYMVLMVLIMLNISLAIIMDIYAQVRTQTGETMTLWAQIAYLTSRAIHFKNWVPDMELWERVAEMPQVIVIDELREAFPLMPQPQVDFLVAGATNAVRVIQREGIDATYTVQMIAAINISLEEISQDLLKLKRRGWMGTGLEVANDADRNFVKEILSGVSMQTHWLTLSQQHLARLHQKLAAIRQETPSEWKVVKKVQMTPTPVARGND
eukprot:TRINITY_DN4222_c1_g1_i1.p1 TRINITY_DN4222_c1_g1~~TRINITY_DN4222_c1_g1_i1.p1  ORF type:complete len:803 (-),score=109.85 TRINITY_DN4222_c1_g1_i1:31-2439(-)